MSPTTADPTPHRLSSQTLTGACHCRQIQYTITIPALSADSEYPVVDLDHCTSCRRTSGGLLMLWFIVPLSWLRFPSHPSVAVDRMVTHPSLLPPSHSPSSSDPPREETAPGSNRSSNSNSNNNNNDDNNNTQPMGRYVSSPNTTRSFCANCGTSLIFYRAGEEWVDVSAATLDGEGALERLRGPDVQSWIGDAVGWVQEMTSVGLSGVEEGAGKRWWRVKRLERGDEGSEIPGDDDDEVGRGKEEKR